MFDQMIATIRENTARMMLTVQIRTKEEPQREQVAKPTATSADQTDEQAPDAQGQENRSQRPMPVRQR